MLPYWPFMGMCCARPQYLVNFLVIRAPRGELRFSDAASSGFGAGGFLPDLPPPPGLPNPMETGFGQEIGDGFNADTGGTTQDSGRFDPIGRANNAANLVEGGQ